MRAAGAARVGREFSMDSIEGQHIPSVGGLRKLTRLGAGGWALMRALSASAAQGKWFQQRAVVVQSHVYKSTHSCQCSRKIQV